MRKIVRFKNLIKNTEVNYLDHLPVEADEKCIRIYCLKILKQLLEKRKAEIEKRLGKKLEIVTVSREEFDKLIKTAELENSEKKEISLGVETGTLIGDSLDHSYTLENYIVASCNKEAFKLLSWTANRPEESCGVVIYGRTGVGKSHLIQGFAWLELFKTRNVAFF